MLVAWRDGGFWILFLLSISLRWKRSSFLSLPPHRFVGQVSGSLAAIEARRSRPRSIRLRRRRVTPRAPRWRLICVWGDPTLVQTKIPSGRYSVVGGKHADSVDGEAAFEKVLKQLEG